MRRLIPVVLIVLSACEIRTAASGRPAGTPSEADSLLGVEQDSSVRADVEAALRLYYDRLSARDWRAMKTSFSSAGTITARWMPPGERQARVAVLTADEFVKKGADGARTLAVFSQRMVHAHVTGYGDVADAWVIFERRSARPREAVKTTRGIDAFHLYRDEGEWKIVSLTYTTEEATRPLVAPPRRPARPRATPPRSGRRSAS
ncbi:MAG: hypothetical protein ACHQU1_07825 [Gemmatimonadales bacterium]